MLQSMKLNSDRFHAFLKCPTKFYLHWTGQAGSGNAYADWVHSQHDAYREQAAKRLMEAVPEAERVISPPVAEDLKTATWRLAVDLNLEAGTMESRLHAVERVPPQGRGKPAQFIPVRFVFFNKLTKDDRLLVAFDALVLSEEIGREVRVAKIIHGDDHTTLRVKTPGLLNNARKLSGQISALLVGGSPCCFDQAVLPGCPGTLLGI
jgi:hypothetical protein